MRTRSSCAGVPRRHDTGFSLVEVVIAILLISLTATAGLVTLRTAVSASATNRDHANEIGRAHV